MRYNHQVIDKYSWVKLHFKDKTDYSNYELLAIGTNLQRLEITDQIIALKGTHTTIKISEKSNKKVLGLK